MILDAVDAMARKVFTENYYHSIFEVQKDLNIGWEIGQINERKLEKLILRPWAADGKNFSKRIWESRSKLISKLHNELTRTYILGKAPTAPPFHPWCRSVTVPYFEDEFSLGETRAARDPETEKTVQVPADIKYKEWEDKFVVQKAKEKTSLDFMGTIKNITYKGLKNEDVKRKVYEVKGYEKIFSQTNTQDAQNTIELIEKEKKKIPQLNNVNEIIVTKDLPGIASYDYKTKALHVNERLSNVEYVRKNIANGYFVAENAEDVLRHEMHHKEHHDLIEQKMLISDKNRVMVKQKLETALRTYVTQQLISQPNYVDSIVSTNAADNLFDTTRPIDQLNELIAEVLLQSDKGIVKDLFLLKKVGEMFL